ncbi:MAG: hypothetical protein OQK48_02330 [Sulfurimonas sp.]|nr:hypothetical protein [Sulfurimonas sp.]
MKAFILLLPVLALALSPFESKKSNYFDTSAYDTKVGKENVQAAKNVKIKCRQVCDKKVYKEQKISEAVEFYKRTRNY